MSEPADTTSSTQQISQESTMDKEPTTTEANEIDMKEEPKSVSKEKSDGGDQLPPTDTNTTNSAGGKKNVRS